MFTIKEVQILFFTRVREQPSWKTPTWKTHKMWK